MQVAANDPKWKQKLRPASFRGVSFFVDSSKFSGGRRGVTHEFPGRDEPYREDLGRKARGYPVEAYLVGKDYMVARNELITALEKEGSGELIHPYYGKVIVSVDGDFDVSESSAEGGFVKFSLKFIESGKVNFPTASADTKFQLGAAASAVNAAAKSDFDKALSVAKQPGFIAEAATAKVQGFADQMSSYTSNVSGEAADIANLAFSIRNLKSSARDLLNSPSVLSEQMANSFSLLKAAANPSDVLASAKKMFGFGDSDSAIPATTNTRAVQQTNQTQMNSYTQVLAVSTASVAAADVTYTSTNEAIASRDDLTAQIDKLMESGVSDDTYSALQVLRTTVTRAVPQPGQDLATVTEFTPDATIPSIVLAYRLYGSQDLEQDIIDRNKIAHPGFIQGSVPLEVLDSG